MHVGGVGGAFLPPKRIFLHNGIWYRTQTVGGHYRRKALYGTLHRAVYAVYAISLPDTRVYSVSTCKYEPLV